MAIYQGPHSIFAWQMHGEPCDPPLRQHESGPDVPDLVHPGDWIHTSYGSNGLVVDVRRYENAICGRHVIHYGIRYWARCKIDDLVRSKNISLNDFWYINEIVAVDGKLHRLFLVNKDTLKVVCVPKDIVVCDRAWVFIKKINAPARPIQLSLFAAEKAR